jgi:hypothetical protein
VRGFAGGPELQTHPVLPKNAGRSVNFCTFRGLGVASEGLDHPRGGSSSSKNDSYDYISGWHLYARIKFQCYIDTHTLQKDGIIGELRRIRGPLKRFASATILKFR